MDDELIVTISIRKDEIINKSDEEIADLVMDKLRIEMNKIVYGKKGQ